jgi:hypothetical protein
MNSALYLPAIFETPLMAELNTGRDTVAETPQC